MTGAGDVVAGRYRLIERLGSGGMGSVWSARDEQLRRTVALKRLHASGPDAQARFRREARLGASLRHPGLVAVFDVVTEGTEVVLVMEHVDGESLAARLAREGGLAPADALPLLRQVAAALDHAHAAGVVHRDVKPANILLGRDGRARLADLGVARGTESTQITQQGSILGTAAYVAPEQLSGADATAASDVYALAAVAFEVLSGRAAWLGDSAVEVLSRIARGEAPDLRAAWPGAPPAAAGVLRRGLARDPADRPERATALVDELERALPPTTTPTPTPTPAPAPAPPRRPPRRRLPLAPAALAVAIVAVAAVLLLGGDDPGRPGAERAASPTPAATATATSQAAPPDERARTPAAAVRGFYERAAAGDFAGAWALAGDAMRAAFGSQAELARQLGSLESIEFTRLDVAAAGADRATVTVATVARHRDRVDRCTGPLRALRGADGGWRVDPAGIRCTRSAG